MCGILCLISQQDHGPSTLFKADRYDCDTEGKVWSKFYKEPRLSRQDMNKLNNQDKLRHLNDEMVKLGNNIKVDNSQRITDIKDEIQGIIGEEESKSDAAVSKMAEFDMLVSDIACRGPDYISYRRETIRDTDVQIFSSVLSLRQPIKSQPIVDPNYVLQFNGELYNAQCEDGNDTAFLLSQIIKLGVVDGIGSVNGEFAFNVIDKRQNCVFFGRDSIGKRSLCYKVEEGSLMVSSVPLEGYDECEAGIVYCFGLSTFKLEIVSRAPELTILKQLYFDEVDEKCHKIYSALKHSCDIRQKTIHPLHTTEANLAVLFSGGIDCTIIAALLMENIIDSTHPMKIDLLTVGFDNPRTGLSAGKSPDRELSLKSWFHLAKKYKHKNVSLRLIEIDVSYELWLKHKAKVQALMYPQQTEMDLSIAIAFHFASNSVLPCKKIELLDFDVSWEQFVNNRVEFTHTEEYVSSCKVLFSGLGADELFGGYSRHEALFSSTKPDDDPQNQYNELVELLKYDINVIHKRNLGRDDRVISGWGKELRYPYLDYEFVKMVMSEIEPNLKIKLEWTTTKKGKVITKPIRKWILRQAAGVMGLDFVKDEIKRAIQFGAKSAKLEIGQSNAKGTDPL